MFGAFRYLLASLVVHGHVCWVLDGQINWLGWYAVFAFFVLSGFLMTQVLHRTYGYEPRGTLCFLANRSLRIYPAYWAAVSLAAAVVFLFPKSPAFSHHLYAPPTAASWVYNLTIFGMRRHAPALILPAWSLHIELFFYLLMALGVSKTRRSTAIWLALSLAWTAWAVTAEFHLPDRYSKELPASLPFAAGALLYFTRRPLPRWCLAIVGFFFAHAFLASRIWSDVSGAGFYASLVLAIGSVYALHGFRASSQWRRLDRFLGDLSYPIFLLHAPVAAAIAALRPGWYTRLDLWFVTTFLAVNGIGLAMHRLIETPIERWRRVIRDYSRSLHKGIPDQEPGNVIVGPLLAPVPGASSRSAAAAAAVVLFGIAWTRILRLKFSIEYADTLIALASLSFAVAPLLFTALGRERAPARSHRGASVSIVAVISTVVAYFAVVDCFIATMTSRQDAVPLLAVWGCGLIVVSLFATWGVAFGALIVRRHGSLDGSLRGALAGVAMAFLAAGPALHVTGAPALVFLAAILLLWADGSGARTHGSLIPVAFGLTLLACVPVLRPDMRIDKAKPLSDAEGYINRSGKAAWRANFYVDVLDYQQLGMGRFLTVDGAAGSSLGPATAGSSELGAGRIAQNLVYGLAPSDPRVLILGVGAPGELEGVFRSGAREISVITSDRKISGLLSEGWGIDRSLEGQPIIRFESADLRSAIGRDDQRRDVIQIGRMIERGTPWPLATAQQNTSSRLYTRDALVAMLRALEPAGIITTTFIDADPRAPGREAARFLATAREALESIGITDPASHIVVFSIRDIVPVYHLVVSRKAFTTGDCRTIDETLARVAGAKPIHCDTDPARSEPFHSLLTLPVPMLARYYATQATDYRPVTDDAPYFSNFARFSDLIPWNPLRPQRAELIPAASGQRLLLLVGIIAVATAAVGLVIAVATDARRTRRPAILRAPLNAAMYGLLTAFFTIATMPAAATYLGGFPTAFVVVGVASCLGGLLALRLARMPMSRASLTAFGGFLAVEAYLGQLLASPSMPSESASWLWLRGAIIGGGLAVAGFFLTSLLTSLRAFLVEDAYRNERVATLLACALVWFIAGLVGATLAAMTIGMKMMAVASAGLILVCVVITPGSAITQQTPISRE